MDEAEQAERRRFEELMDRSEALRRQSIALTAAVAGIKAEVELLRKEMELPARALKERMRPCWEPGPRILDDRHFEFRGEAAGRSHGARTRREDPAGD
jgi:hypothetical protein